MQRTVRLGLVLLCLLVPAALRAQGGAGPRERMAREAVMQEAGERRAFELLLRHRGELALSGAQVERLEAIARQLEARNRPLRQRLLAERQRYQAELRARMERLTAEQRRDTLRRLRAGGPPAQVPAAMRPTVEEMRRNIRQATQEAQGVLTPAQKERARALVRQQVRERREDRRERWRERRGPAAPGGW